MTPAGPRSESLPARAVATLDRLPAGSVELGCRYLRRASCLLGDDDGPASIDSSPPAVSAHLVRPLLLVDDWPEPSDPLPVGSGAVHADLTDEDRDTLARLREVTPTPTDPEALARQAQEWRLAVTPYRRLPRPAGRPADAGGTASPPAPERTRAGRRQPRRRWLGSAVVVDLTALWAGPLATALLAGCGARVIKIDPGCRPDALRDHSAVYRYLNGGKETVDLDLRLDDHRHRFEQLVAGADLVIDSFSRRVMPNLGYGPAALRALDPDIATISIVAFPAGTAEADWLSYGPGVHASAGLGTEETGEGVRFRSAPIAYPDALAGLAAFAVAVELLTGSPGPSRHREISLAGAIAPLVEEAIHGGGATAHRSVDRSVDRSVAP